ncbi:MAG: hypothetical protein P8H93_02755 [Polaribacter sp.]|jgi:hypothetical protein|nr:hypothetical protein [Polaribacter sp.]
MKAIKLVSITVIIVNLSQCRSINIEKEPPFQLKKSAYKNWVDGIQEVRGANIQIKLSKKQP